MTVTSPAMTDLSRETLTFYRDVLQVLNDEHIDYLVGGAYALALYTGIVRHTKDMDLFVRPQDCERILDILRSAGYQTDLSYPHWLAKAYHAEEFVDIIFSSGNGIARVDDRWFAHAPAATFLGEPVRVIPVEEMIWSKAFVCERERYDGADINHLLRAHADALDWPRLLERFGPHWRLLFSHVVLFGFVYPTERQRVPAAVMTQLLDRLRDEVTGPAATDPVCRGTLLSRIQYLIDIDDWGLRDGRLDSGLAPAEARAWTEAGLQ
jgi:hypothetical protein